MALVIVLMFVVLLTTLVLALLSRSLSNGLISGASSNGTRTDLYARGSVDQILGDLRQEIADGSTKIANANATSYNTPYTVPTTSVTIYLPTQPGNAVPCLVGPTSSSYGSPATSTSLWNTSFANVVKESIYNVPFYQTSGASNQTYNNSGQLKRAANVASTSASLNGRYISPARWNQALLLPKKSASITYGTGGTATSITSDSGTDTTPVSSFGAPDWILTAVDGTNPTAWNTSLTDPKGTSYVVGRYAYTIYNEGGLLDANVAGAPAAGAAQFTPNSTGASASPWTQATVFSKKGSQAFADLTQLPGLSSLTPAQAQAVVDQIVGWRNSATAQPSGSFPAFTLPTASINNYFSYLLSFSTGFMSAANSSSNTQSDQAFTSRQQLISFLRSVANGNAQNEAYLQDALMYLTHFSRTLNQPSYWPDPTRPEETIASASGNQYNSASGNEDGYNPPFRAARVTSSFKRNDGTTAVTNPPEPLVKKRFALSRLCWITYKGPSANLATSDLLYKQYLNDGVSPQLLSEGTDLNILAYFGLKWNGGGIGGSWTYDHGVPIVGTLSQVQGKAREPDFFELLQAAVKVGGISNPTMYPNGSYSAPYLQNHDTSIVYQILRLGANIIDGANPTQYPTHIKYGTENIYGAMDLPYLYAYKNVAFLAGTPASPPPANSTPVPTPPAMSNAGTVAALTVPVIWNPYDVNGPQPAPGLAIPSTPGASLRITAVSLSAASPWTLTPRNSKTNTPEPTGPYTTMWANESDTALDFNNSATLYREPTALCQPAVSQPNINLTTELGNLITNSNASWSTGIPEVSPLSNKFLGFFLGTFPQCWSAGSQIYPADIIKLGEPAAGILIQMEYSAGGAWVPYQEYHLDGDIIDLSIPLSESSSASFIGNGTGASTSLWNYYTQDTNGWSARTLYDPRTNRWGTPQGVSSYGGYLCVHEFTDGTGTTTETVRPYATPGCSWIKGAPNGAGWLYPNVSGSYSWNNGISPGGIEQNIGSNNANVDFYTDSDGVVRRAMGGYVKWVCGTSSGQSDDNGGTMVGLPLATTLQTGYDNSNPIGGGGTGGNVGKKVTSPLYATQSQSRPLMLHRPYRSVAELGCVFSDTPWRNIDFFTPESSYSALLDLFCINEDYRPDALAAGRVDLNTRQAPVIQALLAGTYRDEESGLANLPALEAIAISQDLVTRTTVGGTNPYTNAAITSNGSTGVKVTGPQPLSNIADLVGHWVPGSTASLTIIAPKAAYDGSAAYDGFSADLSKNFYSTGTATTTSSPPSLGTGQASPTFPSGSYNIIQRFRETAMRALSDAGQAGTWNLMIDLVAQTGRYPGAAKGLADFLVEGERHYWVHLAIDRQTGQVIDENIEVVNE